MFDSLQSIYYRLLNAVDTKHYRFLYSQFNLSSRLTGLIGPRGAGKTTLLLQIIKQQFSAQSAFYFSADHIYFSSNTLYALVEELHLHKGINIFFIDEIHRYEHWNQELKNLYDGFPSIRIVFSGSSSLDIVNSGYDLSRRAKMYTLPGLSFREYLNFYCDHAIKTITYENLIKNHQAYDTLLTSIPKIKGHFQDYLEHGYYPFYQEDPLYYHEKLLTVIDKTIYEDIANFYHLKTENLQYFKKILYFLGSIPPGNISIHNIAKNISIDDKTVANYLLQLKKTGLVQLVFSAGSGSTLLRRPDKVFISNTNLHYAITGNINHPIDPGTTRELFFIQSLTGAGKMPYYSQIGDYQIENIVFEIGGKNKTMQQIKDQEHAFLVKDDILVSRRREIPLMLFGFLY